AGRAGRETRTTQAAGAYLCRDWRAVPHEPAARSADRFSAAGNSQRGKKAVEFQVRKLQDRAAGWRYSPQKLGCRTAERSRKSAVSMRCVSHVAALRSEPRPGEKRQDEFR